MLIYTYTQEQLAALIALAIEQATTRLLEEIWELQATIAILKEAPRDAA